MNKIIITAALLFLSLNIFAQKADDIIGKYHLPNKLDIEIYKKGNKFFGKVIALNGWENGQTKDYKNPDKAKQNEPLKGKTIIKNLEFDANKKEWINGEMYGPEKGMFFNLKVTEIRKNEVEVVGSKYFFWKTLIWEKI
jgi:uncharacterized protein (DUF2147 family)